MLLKQKLPLLTALAAALPIGVAGLSTLEIVERSAVRTAEASERREAQAEAARIAAEVDRLRDLLRLFARRSFDFGALSARDVVSAEQLFYALDERITIASIVRASDRGEALSYHRRAGEAGTRPSVSGRALAHHAAHVPIAAALAGGEAVSSIYRGDGGARLAIAVATEPTSPKRRGAAAVVAIEIAVDALAAAAAPRALLFDAEGQPLDGTAPGHDALRRIAPAANPRAWGTGVHARTAGALATFVSVPGYGWGLATETPLPGILAPAHEMRARILFWAGAGALAALLAGLVFARGIARPLGELAAAARRLGDGDLGQRLALPGDDELALLGKSFNGMADALDASQAELRRWNAELQRLVDERTADLREAMDELFLFHRQAAVGQLGAGAAHEINNPLTYLIGALQLLPVAPVEERERMVTQSLESARRIQSVVAALLKVTQSGDEGERGSVDVNSVVEDALRLVGGQLAASGIVLERQLGPSLPRVLADAPRLTQALIQIINNAREAMPEGGDLRLETQTALGDKLVLVRVVDTGMGISLENLERLFDPFFTTRAGHGHKGLGLSLAYRIVKDHGGSIIPESRPGMGTCFTVRLPALPRSLSLA